MSRLGYVAVALAMLPASALAEKKKVAEGRQPASNVIPAHLIGESKPSGCRNCGATSIYPDWMAQGQAPLHAEGHGAFGDGLRYQLLWDQHECAPDGCIKPLGCGNLWTEIKFIFGSCRQFFGTAESTVGHHRNTRDRWLTPYR